MGENLLKINDFSLVRGQFQLNQICLEIESGEIFAILGPTGAGKTVLLESIAGIHEGLEGAIYLQGKDIKEIPHNKRNLGFVYQDYGLFPHMTVLKNIQFGLKMNKVEENVMQEKVKELSSFLGIDYLMKRYPKNLSGGEKQRVALARTLVLEPKLLLMDEPFSALDPKTKERMYQLIEEIHKTYQCTILFITHDFTEAQRLASRVGIIIDGKICGVCNSNELFLQSMGEKVEQFLFAEERKEKN